MSSSTHLHWIIYSYDRVEEGTGNLIGNTVVDLLAESRQGAMKRAKALMPNKMYLIKNVIEHFDGQPCSKG